MTAKKQIIQRLRKEVKELKVTIKSQRIALRRSEHRIKTLKYDHFLQDEDMASRIDGLRFTFNTELAWQQLSGNPNDQLAYLNFVTRDFRNSVDCRHETYMLKNLDNSHVRYFYNQKMKRAGEKI